MPDPLSTPEYRVRREHHDHNLHLVLESREIRRIRRAQRKRDAVAWAAFAVMVAFIIVADLIAQGRL